MNLTDTLSEINTLFTNITRNKIFKKESEAEDFEKHVQSCLKLNDVADWNYIISSEDILEDTNCAIENFLKFGLSGATKYNEVGEKYLRLYGLLNATYLQQQSIMNLHKYFQCTKQKQLNRDVHSLKIRDLRHKLGAHSTDYENKVTNKIHSFVPVRMKVKDFECDYFDNTTDEYYKVNLKDSVEEHLKLICNTYYAVVKKSIGTIYKKNSKKIKELSDLLYPIRESLDGNIVHKIHGTDNFYVVKIFK